MTGRKYWGIKQYSLLYFFVIAKYSRNYVESATVKKNVLRQLENNLAISTDNKWSQELGGFLP